MIGICGGSASGKTTLASALGSGLKDLTCTVITLDNYYKDFVSQGIDPETVNYDTPESLDFSLFASHLSALKEGIPVDMPNYDFSTHTRRKESVRLIPAEIILVEGLFLFNNHKIRDLFDLKVYIRTEKAIRMQRRIRRDVMERGRSKISVIKRFNNMVQPMHELYVHPNSKLADMVISGNDNRNEEFALLVEHIRNLYKSKIEK